MKKPKANELVRHEVLIDGRKVDFLVRTLRQMCVNPSEAMAILMAVYMQICENETQGMTQLEMADIAHKMIVSMEDEPVPERDDMH